MSTSMSEFESESESGSVLSAVASPTVALSRRRFGRGVLLGATAVAGVAVTAEPASAGPATAKWLLGGNNNVAPDGSNFLGTRSAVPLIFKTAPFSGNPVERMRIMTTGEVGIGVGAPDAKLHVSGSEVGIRADTSGTTGATIAVHAYCSSVAPDDYTLAIRAENRSANGEGRAIEASHAGSGVAVSASSAGGPGVLGSGGSHGVYGSSTDGLGVFGISTNSTGVTGSSSAGGGQAAGVMGQSYGFNSNGVIGIASNGASAYGVWGQSTSGFAGFFSGKVTVTGMLSKGGGSFQIDHPLDPANSYLYHSFVESPDMMNVYNGNAITDDRGYATVTLPSYFEALNRDFRYQLTVLSPDIAHAVVAAKIADGAFTIRTDRPSIEVSWQVTGIRQDAFANANRVVPEVAKPLEERGTYLHPQALGKPEATGVTARRFAALTAAQAAIDARTVAIARSPGV